MNGLTTPISGLSHDHAYCPRGLIRMLAKDGHHAYAEQYMHDIGSNKPKQKNAGLKLIDKALELI